MAWTVGVVPRQPAWRFAYTSALRVVDEPARAPSPPPPAVELVLEPPAPPIIVIEVPPPVEIEPEPAPPELEIEPEPAPPPQPEPEAPSPVIRHLVSELPRMRSGSVAFTPPPPEVQAPSRPAATYVAKPVLGMVPARTRQPRQPRPVPAPSPVPPPVIVVEPIAPPPPPLDPEPILEVELETRRPLGCVPMARTCVVTFLVEAPAIPVLGPRERSHGTSPERTYFMRGLDVSLGEMVTWSSPIADAAAQHYGGTGPVLDVVVQRVSSRRAQ